MLLHCVLCVIVRLNLLVRKLPDSFYRAIPSPCGVKHSKAINIDKNSLLISRLDLNSLSLFIYIYTKDSKNKRGALMIREPG